MVLIASIYLYPEFETFQGFIHSATRRMKPGIQTTDLPAKRSKVLSIWPQGGWNPGFKLLISPRNVWRSYPFGLKAGEIRDSNSWSPRETFKGLIFWTQGGWNPGFKLLISPRNVRSFYPFGHKAGETWVIIPVWNRYKFITWLNVTQWLITLNGNAKNVNQRISNAHVKMSTNFWPSTTSMVVTSRQAPSP